MADLLIDTDVISFFFKRHPLAELYRPHLLGNRLFLSFDGGTNWVQAGGTLPTGSGGAVGTANARAPSVLVVSPKFPLEVFLVTNDRCTPGKPALLDLGIPAAYLLAQESDH